MAFGAYKNIEDVAKQYQISVTISPFVESLPVAISEHFQQELTYIQQHLDVRMSEAS